MGYLVKKDYKTYIQGDYLRQLLQGDDDKRITEENVSVQTIVKYLTAKFDLDFEFTQTLPYDKTKIYGAGERVTIDISSNGFTAWETGSSYLVDDLVIYNEVGYVCTEANSDEEFTPANWDVIGVQHSIYYVVFPPDTTVSGEPNPATLTNPYAPMFNYKTLYSKGDIVWWKGYTYESVQGSTVYPQWAKLQYTEVQNIPYANVFPDDPIGNKTNGYWKDKTAFAVPAGTLPTNTTWWIKGDNRNQLIKDAMVRITVFKLSPLIAPKNVPSVWLDDYRSILRELKEIAMGDMSITLPYKQPTTNLRTAYGGFVKNVNGY